MAQGKREKEFYAWLTPKCQAQEMSSLQSWQWLFALRAALTVPYCVNAVQNIGIHSFIHSFIRHIFGLLLPFLLEGLGLGWKPGPGDFSCFGFVTHRKARSAGSLLNVQGSPSLDVDYSTLLAALLHFYRLRKSSQNGAESGHLGL